MIAPVEQTLIKEHRTDPGTGAVTLFMPNIGEDVAASVQTEVTRVNASHPMVSMDFQHDAGTVKLEIKSDDLAQLALSAAKIMTRRVQVLGEEMSLTKYASFEAIRSVLTNLKRIAQRENAKHIETAIDKLISAARQADSIGY